MNCVEFKVSPNLPERYVACRLAMLAGTSGPLDWETEEGGMEANGMPIQTEDHVWLLGNNFTLTKTGPETYQLSHRDVCFNSVPEFLQSMLGNHG